MATIQRHDDQQRIARLADWQKTLGVIVCLGAAWTTWTLLQGATHRAAVSFCMVTAAVAFIALASAASVEHRISLCRRGEAEPDTPFGGMARFVGWATVVLLVLSWRMLPLVAPLLTALLLFGSLAERFERRPPTPSSAIRWLRWAVLVVGGGMLLVLCWTIG